MGEVLSDSMDAFIAVTFLVFMFIIVFTTLGLHMFGDLILDIEPNFNTFMNSFITVFQVRAGSVNSPTTFVRIRLTSHLRGSCTGLKYRRH